MRSHHQGSQYCHSVPVLSVPTVLISRTAVFSDFKIHSIRMGRECGSIMKIVIVEGTVDFIFGWSTAVFNRCHIHSKRDGYVTLLLR